MKIDDNTQEYVRKISEKLPTPDALLRALTEQHQVIGDQQKHINILQEQVRLLRAQRYGKSSEKSNDQSELFNEAELAALNPDPIEEAPQQDTLDKPKKKKKGREGLSPDLPREQILFTLSDEEKVGAIDTFFVTVKEELDITPAKVQVLEYRQEKAVFIDEADGRRIIEAKRAVHPLGKAICSTQLLAYIVAAKYCDSLPLYRLEGILKRYGGSVSRTTLAQWLIRLSLVLQPLINLMQEVQLSGDYLQGDETRMKVLKEPGMEPSGLKWMWVMRGGPPGKPVVVFSYDRSRGKAVAKRLLEDFQGRYFQSDGYASYDGVCKAKGIVHLGCMDHARRKFKEAEKGLPKSPKTSRATMALSMINTLYRIEREIKELDSDEKLEQRQARSLPALSKLRKWLEINAPKTAKGSLTRIAMDYTLNQWPKLINYSEHGDLNISNVLAENAIRPFVIGRKSWMFADTPAGAKASALYYSLIETAKANGLEPYDYMSRVIGSIAQVETVEEMEALLPWNMK